MARRGARKQNPARGPARTAAQRPAPNPTRDQPTSCSCCCSARRKRPSLLQPSHFDVGLCRRSQDGRRTVRRTARRADSNAEVGADNGAGGVRKRNLTRGPARTTAQGPAPIPTRRTANATSRCLLWLIVVSDRRASEAFRCGHRRVISPRSHRSRESHVAMGLETLSLLPPTLQWDSKR